MNKPYGGSHVVTLPELDLGRLPEIAAALAGRAEEHDRDGSFPYGGIAELHGAGLLTATVARRYGGPGAGLATTVDILHVLGAGDPSVALTAAMTLFFHACGDVWPERPYRALVADSAAGPALVNWLRVEPELGTPARGGLAATLGRADGDDWLVGGHKLYSTGGPGLRWMAVFGRTDEDPPRQGHFLLRADSPGVTVEPTWDHLGLRASRSDDVLLRDVRVPRDAFATGTWPDQIIWNNLGLTALYLGVAEAAKDWLAGFLHERTPANLGRPLATLPRFQAEVGEIEAALSTAADLVCALACRYDEGDLDLADRTAAAKLVGTRAAIGAVERAVALIGNNALTRRNPLERHLRDVLCARVHTPQDDAVVGALGRKVLTLE
jgi:alkylation response protein AidB-like acyl-CoA dehydrogenase